jgi:NADPH:quinone reductase-like Zn-dependent oxidoreductase
MKVICVAAGNSLSEENRPVPVPRAGEILVRVYAAGVTPSEVIWYPATHTKNGGPRTATVPCHEFSGLVAALGDPTSTFAVGERVFGMNDWFAEGALAEYCVTVPSSVAPLPANLSHVQAASVPIGALTAWQGLFDRAKLRPGDRILIHGAAGAVGLYAVQLARLHGTHVIATASSVDLDFISSLGADQVIDYKGIPFEQLVGEVDVVFDTVGGETLSRSWPLLKTGGRMVTIAAASEQPDEERVKKAFFIVEPNQHQLTEVGKLLESGKLRAFVASVTTLSQSPDAFSGKLKRQGQGKIVVELLPESTPPSE